MENGRLVADPQRLQAFLRASAALGRTVVEIPPFTAFIDPHDPLRYLSYAIPDGDVRPRPASVERLRDVFRAHKRLPRLEWVEEAAPHVADALASAGMRLELRAPLMTCAPAALVAAASTVEDVEVSVVGRDGAREVANLQRVAFGQSPLRDDEEPRDPPRGGGGSVVARIDGPAVAAAGWTPVVHGVSEIVGVATAEAWRGRRLAGVVTAAAAARGVRRRCGPLRAVARRRRRAARLRARRVRARGDDPPLVGSAPVGPVATMAAWPLRSRSRA